MNKLVLSIAAVTVFGLAMAGNSYASYGQYGGCTPIYGGGETCETSSKFTLDKKVLSPDATKGGNVSYVDNLSINEAKFAPNETVSFELTVANTSVSTINELVVTDTLPSYVNYVSGPGSYDENSSTITFNVTDLKAGESRKFYIETKVVDASQISGNETIVCAVNQAMAKNNGDESRDNSQFCIQKSTDDLTVMPAPVITETPSTGPGLALLGLIPAGLGGILLRRKSK